MKNHWLLSCGLAGSLLCTAVVAHAASGSAALQAGVGNWKCIEDGVTSFSTDGAFAIISTERMPGDWFVSSAVNFQGGGSVKMTTRTRYDEARKQYVMFTFGEDGTHGYGIADADVSEGLAFRGEMFLANGMHIKFTKTFKPTDNGFAVIWEPKGGAAQTANCVK